MSGPSRPASPSEGQSSSPPSLWAPKWASSRCWTQDAELSSGFSAPSTGPPPPTMEALTLNAVPVVDKTYMTDGGRSATGCADPASFWESGLGVESPAVFVSDWAQLAPTLTKAGALDADQREERVARVQPYLRSLAGALRSTLLGGHLADRPRTSCAAAPVAPAQRSADLAAAAAYYTQQPPAGVSDSSGPYWFDGFVDNPSLPSPNCDPKGVTGASALLCFDAACAPPSASSFECGPRE